MTQHKLPSELQLAILRVLWDQGEARVAEVQAALQDEKDLALTTVATVLSRLEKRGIVSHRSEGRQFVYRALVSEQEVRGSMVVDLTDRVFRGDLASVVSHLLGQTEVTTGDLERVKALIAAKEREMEARHGDR
jgi:predicted transcriptional regulator